MIKNRYMNSRETLIAEIEIQIQGLRLELLETTDMDKIKEIKSKLVNARDALRFNEWLRDYIGDECQ